MMLIITMNIVMNCLGLKLIILKAKQLLILMMHYHSSRSKRWYNYNLIYPLYIFNLLLPTYDNTFLKNISEVPSILRKDSAFRIKLMNKLDIKAAGYIYDSTMQPAKLLPPKTKIYMQKVKDEEKKLNRRWFDSGRLNMYHRTSMMLIFWNG